MWLIRVLAQALLYIVKQYAAPAPGLTSSTHDVNKPSLQRFAEQKQTAQMRCLYCCGSLHIKLVRFCFNLCDLDRNKIDLNLIAIKDQIRIFVGGVSQLKRVCVCVWGGGGAAHLILWLGTRPMISSEVRWEFLLFTVVLRDFGTYPLLFARGRSVCVLI